MHRAGDDRLDRAREGRPPEHGQHGPPATVPDHTAPAPGAAPHGEALAPGTLIAGKYRVDHFVGAGGMSVVFAAVNVELGSLVAIKMIGKKNFPNSDKRLVREARAVARLTSEHTVRVHDVGAREDGSPFIVMEKLVGETLASLVRRRGPLPAGEVATYALHVCEALAEAHAAGIVHRDLKPSNLFVVARAGGESIVKVLDFGIAKDFTADPSGSAPTTGFDVLGSPGYSAPEQVRASSNVDGRADVWGLGVTLYELLAGQRPFEAETKVDVIAKVLSATPRPIPDRVRATLPSGLEAIVLRCLEKDPLARFPHVAALADALAPYAPEPTRAYAVQVRRRLGFDAPPPTILDATAPSREHGAASTASTARDDAHRAGEAPVAPAPVAPRTLLSASSEPVTTDGARTMMSPVAAPPATFADTTAYAVPKARLWPIVTALVLALVLAIGGFVAFRSGRIAPAPASIAPGAGATVAPILAPPPSNAPANATTVPSAPPSTRASSATASSATPAASTHGPPTPPSDPSKGRSPEPRRRSGTPPVKPAGTPDPLDYR